MAIAEIACPPFTPMSIGASVEFTAACEATRPDLLRRACAQLENWADAEDLVQQVLLEAYATHRRPRTTWRAWMFAILRVRLADRQRRRRHPAFRIEQPDSLEAEWPEPASDLSGQRWRWA